MFSRRKVLQIGSAAIVVTAAGFAARPLFEAPIKAWAPWRRAAEGYGDPRLDALAYAILAPNPHNRQPWQAKLIDHDQIVITCDLDRRLPMTDPFDRQTTIGFGCFLELFSMAAAENGHRAQITLFPEGEGGERLDARPIVHIRMLKDDSVRRDPLFDVVQVRRSNKEEYDTRQPVEQSVIDMLGVSVGDHAHLAGTRDEDRVSYLRDICYRAHAVESYTPRTMQESVDLMRFGTREIEANPDGIDLGGPFLTALHLAGVLTRKSIADPTSSAFVQGLEKYYGIFHSAMAHVWLTTDGNSRADQIAAGRAYVRMNLAATAAGVSIHPASAALQEYVEMTDIFNELHSYLGVMAPSRIQMFARIGYGPTVDPSPRWPLETRLIDA
ncbi:MAG: twin-arginine translocation pathway signal protein [Alphaproteobacteria bacterium]|nr:twin-arginine translocation pathway signal protein [Alphaproteobacteria bacterium]